MLSIGNLDKYHDVGASYLTPSLGEEIVGFYSGPLDFLPPRVRLICLITQQVFLILTHISRVRVSNISMNLALSRLAQRPYTVELYGFDRDVDYLHSLCSDEANMCSKLGLRLLKETSILHSHIEIYRKDKSVNVRILS